MLKPGTLVQITDIMTDDPGIAALFVENSFGLTDQLTIQYTTEEINGLLGEFLRSSIHEKYSIVYIFALNRELVLHSGEFTVLSES